MTQVILVLDFGGQYKELIARSIRSQNVYSIIKNGSISIEEISNLNPIGIILTGGPQSVYANNAPLCNKKIFELGIPILGICYGMQLMCHLLGGEVLQADRGEYGLIDVFYSNDCQLDSDTTELCPSLPPPLILHRGGRSNSFKALMSHRDIVTRVPDGFSITAYTKNNIAAVQCGKRKLYGVQFHPETSQTESGVEIIRRFLYDVCNARGDYKLDDYIVEQIASIQARVKNNHVLLALSGGVDSSVCAALLSLAVPHQVTCVFVDHGFMRQDEGDEIERIFSKRKLNFIRVDAKTRFLKRLKGVRDPENKRKIIGEEFIRVFEEQAKMLNFVPTESLPLISKYTFLAQGTIYPDIVESGTDATSVIKSHHNVGGLPKDIAFSDIIEPLASLFKDEVRIVGKKLGLPKSLLQRQPFPGPGLAIRIIGEITKKKLETLKKADAIVREEISKLKIKPDQYFAVLTDTLSVGVKGDARTYDPVIAIRAVKTSDFMTCEYFQLSNKFLSKITSRIMSEVKGVSRVVYDITGKPPATIEWE